MRKLTASEYLEDLEICSRFICCVTHMNLEETVKAVDKIEDDIKSHAIYQYESVQKRSADYVFTRKDGTKCYRQFHGKNEYYTWKGVLYHVNTKLDTYRSIFINC